MSDYLLVAGIGLGGWSWGQTWGYMTAPAENPPRLYSPRRANRVFPLDLPGHGADANGDTAAVLLDECVHSISRSVERSGLKDLVLVGHGFAASLVMQAAEQMAQAGHQGAKRVFRILGSQPKIDHYIATAQLGITIASLGLGMYGEPKIAHFIEPYLALLLEVPPSASIVHSVSYVIALGYDDSAGYVAGGLARQVHDSRSDVRRIELGARGLL